MATGAVTGRHEEVVYYQVGDAFELMDVFTENTEKPGAETSEKKYTVNKVTTKNVSSYSWEMDFEGDVVEENKVMADIVEIAREQKTGGDCQRDICIVHLRKKETDGAYYARKLTVSVVVDEFSDNDGEMQASGTFSAVSDVVIGTFNTGTKKFTAKA